MRRVDLLGWMLGAAAIAALSGAACTEPNARPAEMRSPASPSPSGSNAELAASERGPYTLSREPLLVTLRLPEDRRERLTGSLRLVVEGIEIIHPGAVYEVHLEPTREKRPGAKDPSFLGHIAIYGKPGAPPETSPGFDVTERVRSLAGRDTNELRVLFLPSEAEEAAVEPAEPLLRIRRVVLVAR